MTKRSPPGIVSPIVVAALLLLGLAGCSHWTEAETQAPAVAGARTIALGTIDSADPDRQRVARYFRRALADELRAAAAFEQVVMSPPKPLPADMLVVSGQLVDVDEGSEALRFLVGMGLGASLLRARIEIRDSSGAIVAAFAEGVRDSGRTGLAAHLNPLSVDDLAADMAADTAEAIVRWHQGDDLEPSLWNILLSTVI